MNRKTLLDKLPYFYDNGFTRPIIEAEEKERNILYAEIEDTLKQFFVETATWGLEYWERMLYIKTKDNKSYEERRSVILAKMKITGTSTVEAIRQLCLGFLDVTDVVIHENNSNYTFYVELENPNFSNGGLKDLCNALNTYKPAHLGYIFIFCTKSNIEIKVAKKTALTKLPVCNTFNSGTWWKMYSEGSVNKTSIINAKSKSGYSSVILCGAYRSTGTVVNEDNNAIVGKAIVGQAII